MYARITRMSTDPERLDETRARIGEVRAAVEEIPGLRFWFSTSDEDSGEGVAIAIYDSKESADAAAGRARDLVAGFADLVTKAPEVAEYEVDEFFVG